MNRRDFVKSAAASVGAAALASTPVARSAHAPNGVPAPTPGLGSLRKKPNIVIILTDQERAVQHFPEDWEKNYTPAKVALQMNGLSFNRAYCPSCMCSPSRSSLFTGLFPAQHGVTQTLSEGCTQSPSEVVLDPTIPNLATILQTAGYRCFFKGKWHMNKAAGIVAQPSDVGQYGFENWNPPDAGGDTALYNFGGGIADNDARFIADALNFINTYQDDAPFCLVVSIVNPHDTLSYPLTYLDGGYTDGWLKGTIGLPDTVDENLLTNFKPTAQGAFLLTNAAGLGPLPTDEMKTNYINFYANLLNSVDNQIGSVMDALRNRGFIDDTLIIRTADHGEMGMAHGGLRQKSFVMYEEALRIPLIFSNPKLYKQGFTTDQLASLVDLVPTIATVAEVPNRERYTFMGRDLAPVLFHPESEAVQDSLLFTYDDIRCGQCVDQLVQPPNRMHTLIEERYKYSRYYDGDGNAPSQYEMYDLQEDPSELQNVANPNNPLYDQYSNERERLAARLAVEVNQRLQPLPPAPVRYFGPLTDLPEEGWYSSSWFGYFYADSFPWIFHADHGWLLCSDMGAIQNDFWFYDLQIGWFYTNPAIYPFIYHAQSQGWWYYEQGTSDPRYFYDFALERWIAIPGPGNTVSLRRKNPGQPPQHFKDELALPAHPIATPPWQSPTLEQNRIIAAGSPAKTKPVGIPA